MTNEEILEQQVEALEKLLKLKQAIIEEQEKKIAKLQSDVASPFPWQQPFVQPLTPQWISSPFISVDPNLCPFSPTAVHDYPSTWSGTNHPPCKKCGRVPLNSVGGIVSITGNGGDVTATTANNASSTLTINDSLVDFLDTLKNKQSV